MPISSWFFLALSGIFALVGLFALSVAEGYFGFWSLMLVGFGLFLGFGIIKRHFDAREG